MPEISQDYSVMGYQAAIASTVRLYRSGKRAVAWIGMPGTGKTYAKTYIAKAMGLQHIFQLKLSHHEVHEVAGLPVPDHSDKLTHQYPSADMLPPLDLKGGLLFVHDEFTDHNVPQSNFTCQLVYENGGHNFTLPSDTYHFMTGNRVSDRSGANRILTKEGNRIAIITCIPTVDELFQYGAENGWNPVVLAFLKMHGMERINPGDNREFAPTFFNSFDPSDPAQMLKPQFSSSRSLEALSNYCNYIDQNEPGLGEGDVVGDTATLVGSPTAVKFGAFRKIANNMPDVDGICEGKRVPMPEKTEVLWSLTLTLASRATKDNLTHIFDYLDRGPPEFLAVFARIVYDTKMPGIAGPGINKLIKSPKLAMMFKGK